jgi:hypothetical protein
MRANRVADLPHIVTPTGKGLEYRSISILVMFKNPFSGWATGRRCVPGISL